MKRRSTGSVRKGRNRKAKLFDGQGLSRYERYLKQTKENLNHLAKETK